jgi:hypothetical protein
MVAMLVSVAFHAALFAYLALDVKVFSDDDGRPGRTQQLAEQYAQRSIEVVDLGQSAAAGPVSEILESSSAAVPATDPGAVVETLDIPAQPLPVSSAGTTEMNLAMAELTTASSVEFARSQRGLVLRDGASSAGGRGVVFQPASQAARDAGRRGGGGLGGLDGIGVIIGGGGGDDPVCVPARPRGGTIGGIVPGTPRPGSNRIGQMRLPRSRGAGGVVERSLPNGLVVGRSGGQ